MSTTGTSPIAPEVRLFLARVRHELADLDPEELAEMTDGLEADLTELVAERGAAALGSPVDYAGELRAAAGLEPSTDRPAPIRSMGLRLTGWLDAARSRFELLVDAVPGDPRPLLAWLRPLWWVVRAWIAVVAGVAVLKDALGIGSAYFTDHGLLPAPLELSWPVLLLAIALSVQVGRGRLWPGTRTTTSSRVVLLGLNVLALALIPVTLASVRNEPQESYWEGYEDAMAESVPTVDGPGYGIDEQAGIYSSGSWVTNIYPYDASGKPLVGVQLLNQNGDPISVVATPECPDEAGGWTVNPVDWDPSCWDPDTGEQAQGRVPYPWTNGAAQLENVFPLPTRMQDDLRPSPTAFAETNPPVIGEFPLASVPPVSLPGITPSVVPPPSPAADSQGKRPQG